MDNEEKFEGEIDYSNPALQEQILQEVIAKVEDFEGNMGSFLQKFNTYEDMWKMAIPAGNKGGLSNQRTAETFRATETIATMFHRMWNSSDPNFEALPGTGGTSIEQARVAQEIIRKQKRWLNYKSKELIAARNMVLTGSTFVETPWSSASPYGQINSFMEGTDFIPRSMVQVGFERTCSDPQIADWVYTTDLVTEGSFRKMLAHDPEEFVWLRDSSQEAIDNHGEIKMLDKGVADKLNRAGYNISSGKSCPMELIVYRGILDALSDGRDYVVGILNRRWVVRFHDEANQSGIRPIRYATYIKFGVEPLGIGVGEIGRQMQDQIDKNRNRINDGITFSQFNMWLYSRYSGIKPSDFKMKPWNLIPGDDISEAALRPLTTSPDGVNYGLKLEDMLKQDFRGATGAADTLQAEVMDITATESALAQSEAMRRISVMAEVAGESLLWPHLYVMHQNNVQFLDQPLWLKLSGSPKPIRVNPSRDLPEALDFEMKITTDKDFKPNRAKRLMEGLQVVTSMRQQIQGVDPTPIFRAWLQSMDIDPSQAIGQQMPPMMPMDPQGQMPPEQIPPVGGSPEEGGDSMGAVPPALQGNTGPMKVPLITTDGPIGAGGA